MILGFGVHELIHRTVHVLGLAATAAVKLVS